MDFSTELKKMGYTSYEEISAEERDILINSNPTVSLIDLDELSKKERLEILNSKPLTPLPTTTKIATSLPDDFKVEPPIIEESTKSGETTACLIVGIWDYMGSLKDIDPKLGDAYYDTVNHATNHGDYDYLATLKNSEATEWYILNWIRWLTMYYDKVDIYLMGHGVIILPAVWVGFGCYDYWWEAYGVGAPYVPCVLFPSELYSWTRTNPYDVSTMRMFCAYQCVGEVFRSVALNPNGATDHPRAFVGSTGDISPYYCYYYAIKWNDRWMVDNWGSENAWYSAYQYAWDHRGPYWVYDTYDHTDYQIYC